MPVATPPRSSWRSLLLVSLDNLGDLVFASALPPAIKARYPDVTIGLWCKAYTADIAPLFPDVDWITAADPFWDNAPGRPKGHLQPFLSAIRRVRRARFHAALLASPQWRVAAAVARARVPVRIGQRRNYNRFFLTTVLPPADRGRPVVTDLGALLAPLGITADTLTTHLDRRPLEAKRQEYRRRFHSFPVAAINPFVTLPPVGIPWTIWLEVAQALTQRGYTVVWHGTPAQLDDFRRHIPNQPGWWSAADLTDGTLRANAALLTASDVYLGCDSGPLHLSAALGVPVVGVFPLATKLPRFAPAGRGDSRVVTGTITADAIVAALDSLPHRVLT